MVTDTKGNNKLTPKQEAFALNLFKGLSQREAYIQAGYSQNTSPAVIDVKASELAKTGKVSVRLQALQTEAKNIAIADKNEAGEVATEILRARFADFDLENPTPEQLRSAAVREVVKTQYIGKDGEVLHTATKLKLESPLAAIDRLADLYSWKKELPQYNDNRQVHIHIQGEEAKKQLGMVLAGELRLGRQNDEEEL